jgi:hypothetical protein
VGGFDEYIKPSADAVWSTFASDSHSTYPNSTRITSAFEIKDISAFEINNIWEQFFSVIEGVLDEGTKRGGIAAWGGNSCNYRWLFRIMEDTHQGVPVFHGSKEGYFSSW